MDRDWINLPRISTEYENRVEEFKKFAQRYEGRSDDEVKFRCPCVNCLNGRKLNATQVREHLICDGFLRSYTIWTWHGELIHIRTVSRIEYLDDSSMKERREVRGEERREERCEERVEEDNMEDMIRDVGAEAFAQAHVYETIFADAETSFKTCEFESDQWLDR